LLFKILSSFIPPPPPLPKIVLKPLYKGLSRTELPPREEEDLSVMPRKELSRKREPLRKGLSRTELPPREEEDLSVIYEEEEEEKEPINKS
jgi:hypothetical protein